MSNPRKDLYQAAALTFEQLGFMFATPELEEEHRPEETTAGATVAFGGPFEGRLTLTVTRQVMTALAANMLGQSEPPPQTQQLDALGEIANVVCGNVLPLIAGPKEVFSIGAPEVAIGAVPDEWTNPGPAITVTLPMDEGRADLMLFVNDSRFRRAA